MMDWMEWKPKSIVTAEDMPPLKEKRSDEPSYEAFENTNRLGTVRLGRVIQRLGWEGYHDRDCE
jgi:hypothetical protein